MARNGSELIREIELLRKNLEKIAQIKNSLNASEVLEISQALDEVINEYYRLNQDNPEAKSNAVTRLYPDS